MKCVCGCKNVVYVLSAVMFLVSAVSSAYNLVQLVNKKTYLIYEFRFDLESPNFLLGTVFQSAALSAFCLFATIHEVASFFQITLFDFMGTLMARAFTHFFVASFSLGCCGGLGLIILFIEYFISIICLFASIIESWNVADGEEYLDEMSTI